MIGQPHVLSVTEIERGIQFISAMLTGDAANWTELVTANNLSPPYVSTNPSEVYGPTIATYKLPSTLDSGTTSLTVSNMPQSTNTLYFSSAGSSGLVAESVNVSYNGAVFTFGTPLQNSYPQGSRVQLFDSPFLGATSVLLPGDILFLPISQSSNFNLNAQSQIADVFGSDVAFPVSFANGDIATVQGVATANQRFTSVLLTQRGSLPQHMDFGSKIPSSIGTSTTQTKWSALTRSALLLLPEVSDVQNAVVTLKGTSVDVQADVYPSTSNTALQFSTSSLTNTP